MLNKKQKEGIGIVEILHLLEEEIASILCIGEAGFLKIYKRSHPEILCAKPVQNILSEFIRKHMQ